MNKNPTLHDVLTHLLRQTQPTKRELARGLILAYTPGACNQTEPGTFRLTLSRRGAWPSEKEIDIVRRELRRTLKSQNRAVSDDIYMELYLKAGGAPSPARRIMYHVLFWQELEQLSIV